MAQLTAWRLSKLRHAESALTGEGARLLGGRWNPPGVPIVYSSLSLSLAVLEVLVHLPSSVLPEDWVSVRLSIDQASTEQVDPARLPKNWKRVDHPALKSLGEQWVRSNGSLVLLVPSAVIEGEWNALFNPLHPEARSIIASTPKPFHFDDRLFH